MAWSAGGKAFDDAAADYWSGWDAKGKGRSWDEGKGGARAWDGWAGHAAGKRRRSRGNGAKRGKGVSEDSKDKASCETKSAETVQMSAPASAPEEEFDPDDRIGPEIRKAIAPVAHLETEWDTSKLEKRLKAYFKNGAKGFAFGKKTFAACVGEYADFLFASLFQALGDRPWLSEVDLLGVMDAAVKEFFPAKLLEGLPKAQFEKTVLAAHDRAFEECRFAPLLWETVRKWVGQKSQQTKVYKAIEDGRKVAAQQATKGVDSFLQWWIHATVNQLCIMPGGQGDVPVVDQHTFVQLFQALVDAAGLPLPLTAEAGMPPDDWWLIGVIAEDAYRGRQKRQLTGQSYEKSDKRAKNKSVSGDFGGQSGWSNGSSGGDDSWWNNGGSVKREIPHAWVSDQAVKKPLIPMALPQAHVAKPAGHPRCTQAEDCVGTPSTALYQHVDGHTVGDVYCAECWHRFAHADATLKAVPLLCW